MSAIVGIREAVKADFAFVVEMMNNALKDYYGGDHTAHAERIFKTHLSGGKDHIGFFSHEQKMFIATVDGVQVGLLHIVGKRQATYKISPLIVHPDYRGRARVGSQLLAFAEDYAKSNGARQIYCTVAVPNTRALGFFLRKGFTSAGESDGHYKLGITETMLYKPFISREKEVLFDRPHISVLLCTPSDEEQVRALLLKNLPQHFDGIDDAWVDALFNGYRRKESKDINMKYKVIYVASDRANRVLGVVGATPKKGAPIS